MSLINKMLKDLETRQGSGALRGDARPIFHDLHSVNVERRRRNWAISVVVLVLAAAAGAIALQRSKESSSWSATSAANVAAPPVVVAPAVQPLVAPAPAPSAALPATPPTAAVPTPAESPVTVAKPAAKKPASRPVVPKPAATTRPKTSESIPVSGTIAAEAPMHIEKIERKPSPEELAEKAYRDAARAHANGNPAEAERLLRVLLASSPQHIRARELLAGIQLDGGRWVEAQDALEQGVAQVPEHLPFRYLLARLYLEHGATAQAERLLEDARRTGQTDPELYAFLAAIHQRGGKHGEAVRSYREALALRPEEGRWWVGLGISLEAQQETAPAQDAYRRALGSGRLAANLARYAEDRLKALAAR